MDSESFGFSLSIFIMGTIIGLLSMAVIKDNFQSVQTGDSSIDEKINYYQSVAYRAGIDNGCVSGCSFERIIANQNFNASDMIFGNFECDEICKKVGGG